MTLIWNGRSGLKWNFRITFRGGIANKLVSFGLVVHLWNVKLALPLLSHNKQNVAQQLLQFCGLGRLDGDSQIALARGLS